MYIWCLSHTIISKYAYWSVYSMCSRLTSTMYTVVTGRTGEACVQIQELNINKKTFCQLFDNGLHVF